MAKTTQASRVEILNEGGFRSDGRRQYELRSIGIDLSQQGHADGCATITHGLTQVQVSVFGPREAKTRSHTIHDRRANLNVKVSMALFSTGDRRKRSRGDKYGLYSLLTSRTKRDPIYFHGPDVFWNLQRLLNALLNPSCKQIYIPGPKLTFSYKYYNKMAVFFRRASMEQPLRSSMRAFQ